MSTFGVSKKSSKAKKSSTKKASKSSAKTTKEKSIDLKNQSLEDSASQLLSEAPPAPINSSENILTSSTLSLSDQEATAKALASIKIGPKGVYTEDSIRVYLQEIGRIRLLRPDEEIELARKIADLLELIRDLVPISLHHHKTVLTGTLLHYLLLYAGWLCLPVLLVLSRRRVPTCKTAIVLG